MYLPVLLGNQVRYSPPDPWILRYKNGGADVSHSIILWEMRFTSYYHMHPIGREYYRPDVPSSPQPIYP
jgi:hypothetical protein